MDGQVHPWEKELARTLMCVGLFPCWKCQGLVRAVMVESEHRDGGRSLVLVVLARSFPSISPLFGVTLPVLSIVTAVAN